MHRSESPMMRRLRQLDLDRQCTAGTLIVYTLRLMAYVWALVSVIVPALDWLAELAR